MHKYFGCLCVLVPFLLSYREDRDIGADVGLPALFPFFKGLRTKEKCPAYCGKAGMFSIRI